MENASKTVGIIVLNYNGFEDTKECLTSLSKIDYQNVKIYIVDNASNHDEINALKQQFKNNSLFQKIRWIQNKKNLGYAAGNNVGIRAALNDNCEYILIINNDIVVSNNFLSEMLRTIVKFNNRAIVGPKTFYYHQPNTVFSAGGRLIKLLGLHWLIGRNRKDNQRYNKQMQVDFLPGACMLIPSNIFKEVGLFTEYYFLQWEDIDLCERIKKAGYKIIYEPRAVIWHKVGSTFKKTNRVDIGIFYGIRNRILFHYSHLNFTSFMVFSFFLVFGILPLYTINHLMRGRAWRIPSMFKGLRAGYQMLLSIGLSQNSSISQGIEVKSHAH